MKETISLSNATSAGAKHNKSLKIVFAITATYLIVEVIVGFMSNSLALISDAAHMLTDVAGQALALFAIWMASKPRNNKKSYGYLRTEIFSALINAIVLIFISGYILYEAWQKISRPTCGSRSSNAYRCDYRVNNKFNLYENSKIGFRREH